MSHLRDNIVPLTHDQTPLHHCKDLSGCLADADHPQVLQKMAASSSLCTSPYHRKNNQPSLLHDYGDKNQAMYIPEGNRSQQCFLKHTRVVLKWCTIRLMRETGIH